MAQKKSENLVSTGFSDHILHFSFSFYFFSLIRSGRSV